MLPTSFSAIITLLAYLGLTVSPVALASTSNEIKIGMVGDVMLGNAAADRVPGDWGAPLYQAEYAMSSMDIMLGNLEGVIGGDSLKSIKQCKRCYAFRMDPAAALALKNAGFTAMSIANNHARDFGDDGRQETQRHLSNVGIEYHGNPEEPWAELPNGGRLIAFATNRGMLDPRDLNDLKKRIIDASKDGNWVAVSVHMGAEGSAAIRIKPGTEWFLGENRGDPMKIARVAIDAGADVVWGHGPHVPRAMDWYNDRLIAYSLGNFATYGGFNLSGHQGLAPLLEIRMIPSSEKIVCWKIHSFIQQWPGGVVGDPEEKVLKFMLERTRLDRPDAYAALIEKMCE